MKKQQYQCTLLSDLILNQNSASEGANHTLDFIPGNNFLGIVASHYADFGDRTMEVFHSGKVRFGDAHPASENNVRTLRAAASLYYPKLSGNSTCYKNFHLIPDPTAPDIVALQLKQCRSGFYDYSVLPPIQSVFSKRFAIKSAYDSEHRRSKDQKMFGYESLSKGLVLYFEVEAESQEILDSISQYLVGEKRLGRSRSAQYGLIDIQKCEYFQIESSNQPFAEGLYTVYADGRLIFWDSFGQPTFRPEAKDLGFDENASIVWEKSQIRTFQYAPYNWKRRHFDADRCGIEKGSVFVVRSKVGSPSNSCYVGVYQNEGFGRVIYNPIFLTCSEYIEKPTLRSPHKDVTTSTIRLSGTTSSLVSMLVKKHNQEVTTNTIYNMVNQWVKTHCKDFTGDTFASQWGTIRSIASQTRHYDELYNALFSNSQKNPGYLRHGVAAPKWDERRRRLNLESFMKDIHGEISGNEWLALINLASVMAKMVK